MAPGLARPFGPPVAGYRTTVGNTRSEVPVGVRVVAIAAEVGSLIASVTEPTRNGGLATGLVC